MINIRFKNGAKKLNVQVPYSEQDRKEIERQKGILEFDIKRLEIDLRNINDPETRKFAQERLEELKAQLNALDTVLRLTGGGESGR